MAKTASDLLTNIRRRAQLSQDGGQALSDTDLLAMASDELQNVIAPKIYATRGWNYAAEKAYTLASDRRYRLPSRAAGGTIISVEIVNATPPNTKVNFVHPLQTTQASGQGAGYSYFIYANNIVLSSGCPTSGTMVVKYLMQPSALTTSFETVANLTSNSIVTVESNTLGLVGGDHIDVILTAAPYEIVLKDVKISGVAGTTLTTTVDLTTDAGVRNYSTLYDYTFAELQAAAIDASLGSGQLIICKSGQSYYPQLNDEHHDLLAQRTAMRAMESIGHTEDLTNMEKKLVDLEGAFLRSISPRERGDVKAILQEDFYYDRRF